MKNKRDAVNLLFSAFLVTAYIICSYFFSSFASQLAYPMNSIVTALIFVVFGLLVFYATRVGEGKAVKRFSLLTLIILDLPALYIIIASIAPGLPFHDAFASNTVMLMLASVALGYGIPYTFLSGFELVTEEIITDMPEVEGGVKEDLEEEAEEEENGGEEVEEEIVVEEETVVEGENETPEENGENESEE